MITRIVKVKLKQERLDSFKNYMEEFVKNARSFKNNHHVDFFKDMEDPLQFHIYTIWKTEGALNKFRSSDINKEFKENLLQWGASDYLAWTVENMI